MLDALVAAGLLAPVPRANGEIRPEYRGRVGPCGMWSERAADHHGLFSDHATRRAENTVMRNHIVAGTEFARRRGDEPRRAWREQAHMLARKHVALAQDVRAECLSAYVCGTRPSRPAVRRRRRVVTRSSAASGDSGDDRPGGLPNANLVEVGNYFNDPWLADLNLCWFEVSPAWLDGHGDRETAGAPASSGLSCDEWIAGTF